jgi:hypothetical protein
MNMRFDAVYYEPAAMKYDLEKILRDKYINLL